MKNKKEDRIQREPPTRVPLALRPPGTPCIEEWIRGRRIGEPSTEAKPRCGLGDREQVGGLAEIAIDELVLRSAQELVCALFEDAMTKRQRHKMNAETSSPFFKGHEICSVMRAGFGCNMQNNIPSYQN